MRPPEVYSIDIGTRAAAILVPHGLGTALSGEKYHPAGKHLVGESALRMSVNVLAYVLGSTEYGRFLAQEFPVYRGTTRSGDVFRYAAVRYKGSWDVNPALQNTLLQGLKVNTNIDADFAPTLALLDRVRLRIRSWARRQFPHQPRQPVMLFPWDPRAAQGRHQLSLACERLVVRGRGQQPIGESLTTGACACDTQT